MLRFVGIKELNVIERFRLVSLSKSYYRKLRRFLEKADVILRIKKYKGDGKQKKFSIHIRVNAPRLLFTSQSVDWDLKRSIHKNFKKLLKEIENKFRK